MTEEKTEPLWFTNSKVMNSLIVVPYALAKDSTSACVGYQTNKFIVLSLNMWSCTLQLKLLLRVKKKGGGYWKT